MKSSDTTTVSAPGQHPASNLPYLTVRALSIVSAVVKVLETTMTMVVSGLSPLRARATSTGSTLARKRSWRPSASAAAAWSVLWHSTQLEVRKAVLLGE